MTGLKDIINFILPIPPTVLERNNEFPNCLVIFDDISKNPPYRPRELGRLFTRLCRLTGFSWFVWTISTISFAGAVIIFLYHWGKELNMSEAFFLGTFSCKMIISVLAAILFINKMIFYGTVMISFQLSDRCYEHINKLGDYNKMNPEQHINQS